MLESTNSKIIPKVARKILKNNGAHYIIEDISELPEVIESINTILSQYILPTDI